MPGVMNFEDTPLVFINEAFQKMRESSIRKTSKEILKDVLKMQVDRLSSSNVEVPFLNYLKRNVAPCGRVVRFRCMVQDMFGPEFFMLAYKTRHKSKPGQVEFHTGFFRELADCPEEHEVDFESSDNETGERYIFKCIPIPGESHWVRTYHSATAIGLESDASSMNNAAENSSKYFPLPDRESADSFHCILKVYDDAVAETLKLNDCIDVFGVLSTSFDVVDGSLQESSSGEEREAKRSRAPVSVVHHLHAIHIKPLAHCNPCFDYTVDTLSQLKLCLPVEVVRSRLIDVFSKCLGGDSLAAEFLLLHLISSVYIRRDVIAVGKLTLNLHNIPANGYSKSLYALLQLLLTKAHYLDLTVSGLNSKSYVPRKDYAEERLMPALLQLSSGTELVLDETCMHSGQLNDQGVRNIAALRTLITWQKLDYDFQFHTSEFHTDLNVLILSEGKTMLSSDCNLPVQPREALQMGEFGAEQVLEDCQVTKEVLEAFRVYLTVARLSPYNISDEVQAVIGEDFVAMRQRDSSINAEYLHQLLLVSRLLCISRGQSELSKEGWKEAKILEGQRLIRLAE